MQELLDEYSVSRCGVRERTRIGAAATSQKARARQAAQGLQVRRTRVQRRLCLRCQILTGVNPSCHRRFDHLLDRDLEDH